MKRLLFGSILGLVGTLAFLAWPGRSVGEQPRAATGKSRGENCHTPIEPPLVPGEHHDCANPPDRAAILRALPRVARGVPYVCEVSRDDVEVAVECLVDQVDPPRFYPLVGPAQLHHCHYKCIVSFTETAESAYPFPFQGKRRRKEIVYIDRDHLHLVTCQPDSLQPTTQDTTEHRP